jgi:hypothetical protein
MDGSFLCIFLFGMSTVVAAIEEAIVPYTARTAVSGEVHPQSAPASADVGVGKERVWKSVSARINQINNQLPNYLPALKRNVAGVQLAAAAGGFVYALKTEASFFRLCSRALSQCKSS